ncbi:MAG: alcohol dehydrogenase catalytic domain-containing protein [Acidimicrobiia bacterium]|nr:alcohol dehydrogenase catalytic domain-containing protein [Acidimicrobiia bacterium]MYC44178.1 alcohol dehydrogenase catalytic domain-containing protein [Acidimicrobiia bacterium]MYI19066.1 alcohol dehydrogenase catalytic domain-containing protein [Acidimicrobiia bacterium]
MKAAVFHGRGDVRLEDLPRPEPGDGELLLQVTGVGICGTDASEYAAGPQMFPIHRADPVTGHSGPMVPGHEFAGVVVGTGRGVLGFAEGDPVACGAGISCGTCGACTAGRSNLCEHYWTVGLQRDGALAEFTAVPAAACVNLAERTLASDVAAMAQPMSIAVHAVSRGRLGAGEDAVVVGTGGIGAFVTYAAVRCGAAVTGVDLDPDRLAVAAALGASATVTAEPGIALGDLLAGSSPTVVFECTGVPAMVAEAADLVRPGGRVVVVGLQEAPIAVDLRSLALREKELIGTLAHTFGGDFGIAVEMLESGGDVWRLLAPSVLPLKDLVTGGLAPMVAGDPTPIKTLFDPRIDAPRPMVTG